MGCRGRGVCAAHATARLIGSIADDVPWRIVFTDPDLLIATASDGATDRTGLPPDDLRVVATDAAARVGRKVISPCLSGPGANNVSRRGIGTRDGIKIFAIAVAGPMREGVRCDQVIGPFLGRPGELRRPDQWRDSDLGTHCVVGLQHGVRQRRWRMWRSRRRPAVGILRLGDAGDEDQQTQK